MPQVRGTRHPEKNEATNLVFFPFGMGVFLRDLYKLDPEYAEA